MVTLKTGLDGLLTYPFMFSIELFLYWKRDYICIVDPSNRICLLYMYVGTLKVSLVAVLHHRLFPLQTS